MSDCELVSPRCPVCATAIDIAVDGSVGYESAREEDVVACERCETLHHKECWEYAGGCALFGCRPGKGALAKAEAQSLASTIDWWMGAYRLYASSLAGMSVSLSLYMLLWVFLSAYLDRMLVPGVFVTSGVLFPFEVLFFVFYMVMVLCGLGTVLSFLPSIYARWRVNSILESDIAVSGSLSRGILDRLELSGLSGFLLSVFGPRRGVLRFFIWLGVFSLLVVGAGTTMSGFMFGDVVLALSLTGVVVGILISWPLYVACSSLAFLSTVQNRALVSFKGKN